MSGLGVDTFVTLIGIIILLGLKFFTAQTATATAVKDTTATIPMSIFSLRSEIGDSTDNRISGGYVTASDVRT